jgi:CheY-like chemotaxis protein
MLATLPPSASRARTPLRILLADDHEMLRTAMRGLFQILGCSVDVVANGREAIELASQEDYDFVLLDFQMPEMGGLEAARSLRQSYGSQLRPRIIGLSGQAEERETWAAAGMDDFLAKPVRLVDLIQLLKIPALAS